LAPYFANYVALLHEHGLSRAFLRSLSGTAGPLYAFVQAAFEPLTALSPPGMRLMNVGLLAIVAALLVAMSRHDKPVDRLASASVLVVPMTWVLAGMALSEMPALVFATLSLSLLFKGLQRHVRLAGRHGRELFEPLHGDGRAVLMLVVERLRDWSMRTLAGAALGCAAGAGALFGYYHQ
jgi:4-amino-4-deoxy-L-arabinose transferase-like glycosyltransferase